MIQYYLKEHRKLIPFATPEKKIAYQKMMKKIRDDRVKQVGGQQEQDLMPDERVKLLSIMKRVQDDMARVIESSRREPQEYSYDELEILTKKFSTKLGSGGFGDVYKGHLPNDEPIAVKVLKGNLTNMTYHEALFDGELRAISMNGYNHRYIIKCLGYCDGDKKAIIFEYMENGSLSDAIKNPCVEWRKLYNIAVNLAFAISHLHTGGADSLPPRDMNVIIHNDIKPANVLLDSNFQPKLSDFGLANIRESQGGTCGYIAPEICLGKQPSSTKSDVFSFGMVLFDILGSKRNCADKRWFPGQVWEHFRREELEKIMIDCGIQERDYKRATVLLFVALLCAEYNPQDRPDITTVYDMLVGKIMVRMPVNPFPHYDSSIDQGSTIGSSI